jgi:hypothetical protein
MSNFSLKNYWEPTPKLFRIIGDALLAIGTIITTHGIMEGNKIMALVVLLISILGKFFTNMAGGTTNAKSN